MRNFSWKYFMLTGDVHSFMLYREMEHVGEDGEIGVPDGGNAEFAASGEEECC